MAGDARTHLLEAPNSNFLWAGLVIEELVRNGVGTFCICPGSRSTPLAWAVAEHPSAKSVVHFDERGAAFHALGIAKSSGRPAAFICTSGTAVANAFPAVVEASMAHVPLILLTADRPPELQDTGANQTIDQVNVFGKFVSKHVGLWGPAVSPDPSLVHSTIQQSLCNASGPIHLNCMTDEPLAPAAARPKENDLGSPAEFPLETNPAGARKRDLDESLSEEDTEKVVQIINEAAKGVLLVGGLANVREMAAVETLARALGWPTLPDITSGLRTRSGAETTVHYALQLAKTKALRKLLEETDLILHVGGTFTSKPMLQFLDGINASGSHRIGYLRLTSHSRRLDPPHRATQRLICDIASFCDDLAARLSPISQDDRARHLVEASRAVEACLNSSLNETDPVSEAALARNVTRLAPGNSVLFLGNSMPIRDADAYGAADGNGPLVAANRGASGIDGTIATAAGYARGLEKPVTAVIGDLAALHDLNSLALLKNLPAPVILVIVNNNGGGIFHFLPIAEHPEHFERFFATPHGLRFKEIARAFDLPYYRPSTNRDFTDIYTAALQRAESCIVEVQTDREANLRLHRDLDEKIAQALKTL